MEDKNKERSNDEVNPNADRLLAEYGAANDAYMHYDNFSWHVGAVLIAGTFVFWGFLIENNVVSTRFFIASLLVAILMSAWMMYSSHNRQIYLCKLHRLYELEKILGFKQHTRWIDVQQKATPTDKKAKKYIILWVLVDTYWMHLFTQFQL